MSLKDIKEKQYPKFANFGEYLFYSYANLQMLFAALNMGKKDTRNSSKGIDLFEWYATVRKQRAPLNIMILYLKNIYLYSVGNGLLDKHREEMEQMALPFNLRYIPLDYPQPECFM